MVKVALIPGLISTPSASQVQGLPTGALAGAQSTAFLSPASSTSLWRLLSSPEALLRPIWKTSGVSRAAKPLVLPFSGHE